MTRASDGVTMIWLFSQILFDVIVLNWRNLVVEFLHLLWNYIYCCYMMVLRQQGCYAQTDVACTGYCYFYILKIIHNDIVFLYSFFLKSSRPSLPLKKAPPLTPALSPQERGRKPPYSVLGTATLLGWRTIKGLRQILRDGTARYI